MSSSSNPQKPCCISHAFFHAASMNPNKLAVLHSLTAFPQSNLLVDRHPPVYPDDVTFTADHLLSAVDSLAHRLRRVLDGKHDSQIRRPHGYGDSVVVFDKKDNDVAVASRIPRIIGVLIPPSVEYVVTALAVLRCGEAFLPLDPFWPEERILSVIRDSRTELVVTAVSFPLTYRSHLLRLVDWVADRICCSILSFDMTVLPSVDLDGSDIVWPCENTWPRKFCYVLYTSGSSGAPKGVCGTEEGILNRFWWMQELFPLGSEDVLLFKTSVSFVDHLQEFLGATMTNTTLVVPPFDELKANPLSLTNFLEISKYGGVTSILAA